METHRDIQKQIDNTFDVVNSIEPVNVSPFFKDKTMQRMFAEEEEKQIVGAWFTPKLQLATLVCVVVINIMAFSQLKTTTYDDNIAEFAESYGISTDSDTSILN